jgi:serine phosphatase RsbU (regulator of sigma subunit)/anti-sigma regulatory factor (Ser/Thr protein kinase)
MSAAAVESSRPASFRFTLACDLSAVRPVALSVRNFLVELGWGDNDLMACELALVEACNNAVDYVNESGRQKPIRVEAVCDTSQVEFRVIDHTPGFEWPAKAKLPESASEGGRGLFLINSLMDHAGYFRGQGENILVMRKSCATAASPVTRPVRSDLEACRQKLAENEQVLNELVEELSSCYESLSAIFRYSSEPGKPGDLKDFAHRLLKDLLQIISADWFILRLVPKGESRLVVFAATESALQLEPLTIPTTAPANVPLEIEAALTRQNVWFDHRHPSSSSHLVVRGKPDSMGLAHPFFFGEQLIGTLTVGKTVGGQTSPTDQTDVVFTASQTNAVNTFADFLAIQIVNARLREEEVSSRLVTRDLEIANNIQRSLLPKTLPALPGFGLAGFCRSARAVGGDFYDVLKVTDHSALLVIADVMGKGIPAALFAAILRTLLRSMPELTHQPARLLTRVNQVLFEELSSVEMFITAQLAFFDARERKLTVASAGHCPLLLATGGNAEVKALSPEGMPLGILSDTIFSDEIVELPQRSCALLYTDGLTEALDSQGGRFGQERLMSWLGRNATIDQTPGQLKESLAAELGKFQSNADLSDDQTFLMMA